MRQADPLSLGNCTSSHLRLQFSCHYQHDFDVMQKSPTKIVNEQRPARDVFVGLRNDIVRHCGQARDALFGRSGALRRVLTVYATVTV